MALSKPIAWDVRTTGSLSNGGGFSQFVPNAGTDYSQQDTPAVTGSDLEIDGTNAKRIRSASGAINSSHVGNVIYVTGGAGFTTGRYLIYADAGGGWFDVDAGGADVGTAGSTGGSFVIGGALGGSSTDFYSILQAVFNDIDTLHGAGSKDASVLWVKKGTYSIQTGSYTFGPNSEDSSLSWSGYYEKHGDLDNDVILSTLTTTDNRPTINIQLGSGTSALIFVNGGSIIRNLRFVFDGSFASVTRIFDVFTTMPIYMFNLYMKGKIGVVRRAIDAAKQLIAQGLELEDFGIGTTDGAVNISDSGSGGSIHDVIVRNVTGFGFRSNTNASLKENIHLSNWVVDNAGGAAIHILSLNTGGTNPVMLHNFVITNSNVGLKLEDELHMRNVFDGIVMNCTIGIDVRDPVGSSLNLGSFRNIAFYNNLTDIADYDYINNYFSLSNNPIDANYKTTESTLLNAGILQRTVGLHKFQSPNLAAFTETLSATRSHHWDIQSSKVAGVIDGVVSGEKSNSGAVRFLSAASRNTRVDGIASSSIIKVDVSEDATEVTKAVSIAQFANINTLIMRISSPILISSSRINDAIHRLFSMSSDQLATQIRKGKWNIFDASFVGGKDDTVQAGGFDLTTKNDEANNLVTNKTDNAAHPSPQKPGELTYNFNGRTPTQTNYKNRNLF